MNKPQDVRTIIGRTGVRALTWTLVITLVAASIGVAVLPFAGWIVTALMLVSAIAVTGIFQGLAAALLAVEIQFLVVTCSCSNLG